MEEMVPEPDEVQRAEIERLTRLLFEKAARLDLWELLSGVHV
jgi:hypothetical protein